MPRAYASILDFLKLLALFSALFLGACSTVQEVVPVIDEPTFLQSEPEFLRITGASSMEPLVRELAYTYTRQQPHIIIDVTGGGSAWGLQAVNKEQAEIGMLSRPLQGNEQVSENGLPVLQTTIARDGIALIIHPSNPINRLEASQLSDILSGYLFEWDELGWLAGQIEVVSREVGSGDRAIIEEALLSEGQAFTLNAVLMPDSTSMISYVAKTPTAIGYVSIPHLSGTVKALRLDNIEPTLETLKNGSYPIRRDLFLVTKGVPKGEIRGFIEWVQGTEGQSIIARRYLVVEE